MKIDPIGNFEKAWEAWRKMTDDSIARMTAFYTEMEKVEAKNLERAETAINEATKLTKETIAYGAQLGAEFRKLSIDAVQRAAANSAAAADTVRS